jgi:hypothetical protein
VKKGLAASEWIVVNGLQRARPGAPVNPQKPGTVEAAKVAASAQPAKAEKDHHETARAGNETGG